MYNYHRLSTTQLNDLLHRKEVRIYRLKQLGFRSLEQLEQIDLLREQCVFITAVLAGRTLTLPLWHNWKQP